MNQDCHAAIVAATRYLNTQTAHWETPHLREVLALPECQERARAIDTAALQGDVAQTKAACRAYWKAVLGNTF